MTEKERQAAGKIAYALFVAFRWDRTPQGGPFWDVVFNELRALEKGEEPSELAKRMRRLQDG